MRQRKNISFGRRRNKLFFAEYIIYKKTFKRLYRESIKTNKRIQKAIGFQFNIHKLYK